MRRVEKGMTAKIAYENHLAGDPSQVGASCPEAEGKEAHQDREASFREEGNRDQEGMADGLRKVVRERSRKFRDDCWTHVHRTREGEGVHRIHQEDPCPWEDHLRVVDLDAEDRNRNLQEGVHCLIRRQL